MRGELFLIEDDLAFDWIAVWGLPTLLYALEDYLTKWAEFEDRYPET